MQTVAAETAAAPPDDPPWLPSIAEEVAWDRREREYETETDDD